jgi:hypothetical protein
MAHADIVNSWFREHLAGGALARSTDAYNQVHTALPALIEALDSAEPKRSRKAVTAAEPPALDNPAT